MPANTFLTTAAVGNREDLVDMIWNVAPTDTPLISMIDKVKAAATNHEWQRDTIATPAANAVAEGADASYNIVAPTGRLGNQTQSSRKTFSISATQEAINKAGRSSEIKYQTVLQGKALRKDMELALIENPTLTPGATRVARGLRGWIVTTNSLGAGGVAPNITTNTAPTDGTLRPFTEALLRSVVLGAYNAGSDFDTLMVAPLMKQTISGTFTGNSTRFQEAQSDTLSAAYDVYKSDFGVIKIVPNRVMQRTREAYLIDPNMLALAVVSGRDMQTEELAKTGSARNFMIETEYTLEAREERALGCVRDIQ